MREGWGPAGSDSGAAFLFPRRALAPTIGRGGSEATLGGATSAPHVVLTPGPKLTWARAQPIRAPLFPAPWFGIAASPAVRLRGHLNFCQSGDEQFDKSRWASFSLRGSRCSVLSHRFFSADLPFLEPAIKGRGGVAPSGPADCQARATAPCPASLSLLLSPPFWCPDDGFVLGGLFGALGASRTVSRSHGGLYFRTSSL